MKRYLRGKKLQRGEIATIIAIGTLIIIGATSLFSSAFLGKKQSTSSKAAETCKIGDISDQGCATYGCPKGSKRICTCTNGNWSCQCKADSSCPGGDTGSGAGTSGDGGTVTCNEGYYCEGSDCFKKLKSCGREGPLEKSFCAGQSCGSGGSESPTAVPSQPPGAGGSTGCSWGDWDCAAAGGNNDAGRICGKMGKGFCNPGDCRSEGTGNVCVPNKWGDKSSWGCWGPPIQQCAVQPSPTPKSSSGTDCTPGKGSFGNDGKYYCCFKAGEGERKLPYPHYEDEGDKAVDCSAKTGVGQSPEKENPPANCGPKSYKVTKPDFCGQSSDDANYTYEQGGWCCEPKSVSPPASTGFLCTKKSCPQDSSKEYFMKQRDGKPEGYFTTESACKTSTTTGKAEDAIRTEVGCSSSSPRDCTDSDYDRLADSGKCGSDDGSCGKNQKKYTKAPNNTCNGSSYKCKNDPSCEQSQLPDCGSNRPNCNNVSGLADQTCSGTKEKCLAGSSIYCCDKAIQCYEDLGGYCAGQGGCKQGETNNYLTNCGNATSGRVCCIPQKTSFVGFTTTKETVGFSAMKETVVTYQDNGVSLNCYLSAEDTYICPPKL